MAIIIGSLFIFFMVLMNPYAEQIIQSAEKMGLALMEVLMLCMVAIHGAVFYAAYVWYAAYCAKQ